MFNKFIFENRTVYEMVWKNIAEPGRPQMTVWRMRIACWIPKVTNTHSELYRCTVHFVVYLSNTPTNAHI